MRGILSLLFLTVGFTTMAHEEIAHMSKEKLVYRVIKVYGDVHNESSGKSLQSGALWSDNDKLTFSSPEAWMMVVNEYHGRFKVTQDEARKASATILPGKKVVENRSGAILNTLDLKNHFSGNYVLIDNTSIKINKDAYPMNANNFFYLQYEYNGETIPKKMKFDEDILYLDVGEMFTIDGIEHELPSKMEVSIYYRDKANRKSSRINTFQLVVPQEEQLKKEVKVLSNTLKTRSNKEKKEEIVSYIYEVYGRPQKENLDVWLKKNVKL